MYRTLSQRVALASGAVILVLLLLEAAASLYVDSLSSELDESSRSARAANEEVRRLETEVTKLEGRLDVVRVGSERTQLARTLHDIARTLPRGIRLTELEVRESNGGRIAFQTEGEVLSHERLASYLAVLDTADFCKNVGLASSGSPKSTWGNERKSTTGTVGFELRGEAR